MQILGESFDEFTHTRAMWSKFVCKMLWASSALRNCNSRWKRRASARIPSDCTLECYKIRINIIKCCANLNKFSNVNNYTQFRWRKGAWGRAVSMFAIRMSRNMVRRASRTVITTPKYTTGTSVGYLSWNTARRATARQFDKRWPVRVRGWAATVVGSEEEVVIVGVDAVDEPSSDVRSINAQPLLASVSVVKLAFSETLGGEGHNPSLETFNNAVSLALVLPGTSSVDQ